MNDFTLPTNVRQIGSIVDGPRIYVEDYVNTYVRQLAEAAEPQQCAAFLIGKRLTIDGKDCLFINGAIRGKYVDFDETTPSFSDESFRYAEEQRDAYFSGLDIIGWVHSRPGFGVTVSDTQEEIHAQSFREHGSVLFVVDPTERVNAFFVRDGNNGGLRDVKGYFVYYEQNKGMQEYMLENRVTKVQNVKERLSDEKSKPTFVKAARGEVVTEKPTDKTSYRKVTNMLVSLSAVLFIICFIMGAGLIQSDGRINKLERSVAALDSAYTFLSSTGNRTIAETADAKSDKTAETVFAQSDVTSDISSEDNVLYDNDTLLEVIVEPVAAETAAPTELPPEEIEKKTETPEPVAEEVTSAVVIEDPGTVTSGVDGAVPETYVVEKGDNLNRISYHFYGTTDMVEAIMELNGMDDPDKIFFGKVLFLPKAKN